MNSETDGDVIRAAARGQLPAWACMGPERREHVERVAELMERWARQLGLPARERERWVGAAWLHDALRDAPPERLRADLDPPFRELPDPLLHGPAAASRLGDDADPELRDAVCYHTIGHPSLDTLGRALYLADYLDPGRSFAREERREQRDRCPGEMAGVLREVLRARIIHLLGQGSAMRPETLGFWNRLAEERAG